MSHPGSVSVRPLASSAGRRSAAGFTLIELLVVMAIIGLLLAILLPALSTARRTGLGSVCTANLRTLGQGLTMYSTEHADQLVPGRLPKLDADHWRALVLGGWKYRPTFLAMMGTNVNLPAFDEPMASQGLVDRFGQPGDQQDYSHKVYVCAAAANWTDERNGAYGYNYQFLGNARLSDPGDAFSFKNWPVKVTKIRDASKTVAVADCMGTAATFAASERKEYINNGRDAHLRGNEGFNLDPPRIDQALGEAAGFPSQRTAVDPRHNGKGAVMYLDTHCDLQTPEALGYRTNSDGSFRFDGNNALWSGSGRDVAWTPSYGL